MTSRVTLVFGPFGRLQELSAIKAFRLERFLQLLPSELFVVKKVSFRRRKIKNCLQLPNSQSSMKQMKQRKSPPWWKPMAWQSRPPEAGWVNCGNCTIEFETPIGDLVIVHLEGCMFLCSIAFHAWNQHRQQLMPLFRDQYPGRNLLDRKLPKLTRLD